MGLAMTCPGSSAARAARAFVLETARLQLRLPPAAAAGAPPLSLTASGVIEARAPEVLPDWVRLDVLLAGERIGDVGLLFIEPEEVEIGYRIEPDHRGRGYATEALQALTALAWTAFRLPALEAQAAEDNEPSKRTLRRLGFSATGEAHRIWSARRGAYIDFIRFRLERPAFRGSSS